MSDRRRRPSAVDTDRRPFVLAWELTRACGLACEHCRAEADPTRHPDELTTEEGRALLRSAREFGDGQVVVLTGGDPLARPDAVDLVDYGDDLGLCVTMTPSGTGSLTPERVDALADAGLRRLALSLDGATAAAHDRFRGEPGSFAATLRAARAARDAGLPLQVNTTVCAQTIDQLPAIRDLVADLGAVLWSVFFLVPVGRGRTLDPVDPERAERAMEWFVAVDREAPFGVKTTEAPQFRRVRRQVRAGERSLPAASVRDDPGPDGQFATLADPRFDADRAPTAGEMDGDGQSDRPTAGETGQGDAGRPETGDSGGIGREAGITAGDGFAFVGHTGAVRPSGFLGLAGGHVRSEGLLDAYRASPLFRALRDPDALRGNCGACEFRHVCGGSRSRAFAYAGDPLASDPLCPYVPEGYDGPPPVRDLPATDPSVTVEDWPPDGDDRPDEDRRSSRRSGGDAETEAESESTAD